MEQLAQRTDGLTVSELARMRGAVADFADETILVPIMVPTSLRKVGSAVSALSVVS